MRLNQFIAARSDLSRRNADTAISQGRVRINDMVASLGQAIQDGDTVTLDGKVLESERTITTILLHKPIGYVCSREGQGSLTIYDLLPPELQHLNPVGRLDRDSSGLLLMTNDGQLAQELTHPRYQKQKVYEVILDKPLEPLHQQMINDHGITLSDGLSKLQLHKLDDTALNWQVTMHEGRNRQIRRTFASLGYDVKKLHRTNFGSYALGNLVQANYIKA